MGIVRGLVEVVPQQLKDNREMTQYLQREGLMAVKLRDIKS